MKGSTELLGRTALDAERARDKAIREGVEMPAEDAFDSNCITPGTSRRSDRRLDWD